MTDRTGSGGGEVSIRPYASSEFDGVDQGWSPPLEILWDGLSIEGEMEPSCTSFEHHGVDQGSSSGEWSLNQPIPGPPPHLICPSIEEKQAETDPSSSVVVSAPSKGEEDEEDDDSSVYFSDSSEERDEELVLPEYTVPSDYDEDAELDDDYLRRTMAFPEMLDYLKSLGRNNNNNNNKAPEVDAPKVEVETAQEDESLDEGVSIRDYWVCDTPDPEQDPPDYPGAYSPPDDQAREKFLDYLAARDPQYRDPQYRDPLDEYYRKMQQSKGFKVPHGLPRDRDLPFKVIRACAGYPDHEGDPDIVYAPGVREAKINLCLSTAVSVITGLTGEEHELVSRHDYPLRANEYSCGVHLYFLTFKARNKISMEERVFHAVMECISEDFSSATQPTKYFVTACYIKRLPSDVNESAF